MARQNRPEPAVDGRPVLAVPDDAREAIADVLADLLLDFIAAAHAGTDPERSPR